MFLVAIKIQNTDIFNWEFGKQLIGNLLMLQDFETGKPNIIIPPLFSSALWSLHYEWWFYMLYFPVSVYLQRNRQNFTIGIMGVIAVITYLLYPNALNRLIFYFPIWWTGVILARAYINHNKVKWSDVFEPCLYLSMISSILGIQCILHLINAGKLSLGIHPFLEFRHITVAIFIVYLAIGWQNIQWLGFSKIMGWGLRVAPISYALYISHQPFFVSANYLDESINPVIRKALYFTFLILFCWVTEIIIYPYLKNLQRNR
jgi:peptidoglycan/LPS O-acetylase OafA/YrhL